MIPNPQFVKRYYDNRIRESPVPYLHNRWLANPIDRKGYHQTWRTLERIIGDKQFDLVFEVGPGPGVWTEIFAEHAQAVVAMDISMGMLSQFPHRLASSSAIRRVCADSLSLPVSEGMASAIFCVRAFEYFPDKVKAVAEMARIGRNDCFLIIVTKNPYYLGRHRRGNTPATASTKVRLHSGQIPANELAGLLRQYHFCGLQVRPVTLLRTRTPFIWYLCDFLKFVASKSPGSNGLPVWLQTHVESYVITGYLEK